MKFSFCSILLFFSAALFTGCSESPSESDVVEATPESAPATTTIDVSEPRQLTAEEQKAVIDNLMKARARQQAEGLGGGRVKVNKAWQYSGYSYLAPDPNAAIKARLVAVDLTVSGHTQFFDMDDIEIVDGATMISYGSDPHATYLTLEGELMPADQQAAAPPRASRWLLIYAYPEASPAFHLYYWGKQLTPEPIEIGEGGLSLPFPPEE